MLELTGSGCLVPSVACRLMAASGSNRERLPIIRFHHDRTQSIIAPAILAQTAYRVQL